MAIKTYLEQLEAVQLAIAKLESGVQSYSIGGRSLTRANLKDLYDRERWLRSMVAREENDGKLSVQYGIPI